MIELIRGTTPAINIVIKTPIDLHDVRQVWMYIYQQKIIKIDKDITDDVVFDYDNRTILVNFTQEDTLGLKAGDAVFQMRLLLNDNTALASLASEVKVFEIYKEGPIS